MNSGPPSIHVRQDNGLLPLSEFSGRVNSAHNWHAGLLQPTAKPRLSTDRPSVGLTRSWRNSKTAGACWFPQDRSTAGIARVLNSVALTVYKIDYTAVDEKPEMLFMCLKRLVGERGFEPPTPWSRTRFQPLLNAMEFCCS
jgi:hypothetical protein